MRDNQHVNISRVEVWSTPMNGKSRPLTLTLSRTERAAFALRLIERYNQLHDDEAWEQETLVEESGVPLRTVSDFLRGVSVPNNANLGKLAGALGLRPTAEEERDSWPDDIKDFLDIVGLYLKARPAGEPREAARRRILGAMFREDGAD
jgi:transcriptional regulator with XRE-family HTH domain